MTSISPLVEFAKSQAYFGEAMDRLSRLVFKSPPRKLARATIPPTRETAPAAAAGHSAMPAILKADAAYTRSAARQASAPGTAVR